VELNARRATPGDLPAVAQLASEASAATAADRGGEVFLLREGVVPPTAEDLAGVLSDAAICLAVGSVDGVVLAFSLARLERLPNGESLGRLEFLWVDPGIRELGLGAELMQLTLEWAGASGAATLDAHALPGNREAKNFLEGAGFSARLIVMSRQLDPPQR
jgi:ribosomal protein S18 acetylase RimI-like enzyme